jgi:SAM-dependent methyltransferase
VAETRFDDWIAPRYARLWPELFDPAVLEPAVDFLAAAGGPALEFGIGTGRLALPLARRGVEVHGIELSTAMIAQLRAHPDAGAIGVTAGDFATATVDRRFRLAYLVRNTITNLTSQDEQVACFRNAAAHLAPGGLFVVENYVPAPPPPGETTRVFTRTPTHLGFEEYDLAAQIATSSHYWTIDGELRTFSSPHRYVWPAELDLMARLAGLTLHERWGDWHRAPFTGRDSHISVWRKD